ncbi:MAG: hypothetical protein H7070_16380, partial [Saprospiraceae bacterium]|nr:hypothetical protein [Pyrinomonadaceae bacterium]
MATTQDGRLLKLFTPLQYDFLLVDRLRCTEGLSQLFRVELEIIHDDDSEGYTATKVDPHDVIGKPMVVSIKQKDYAERYFNGICARFTAGSRDGRYSTYHAVIVPKVWVLTQSAQSRIYQNKKVEDILRDVFKAFPEIDWEIKGIDEKRNYCV